MNRTELYAQEIRADLQKLRAEVDELKTLAARQKELDRSKLEEYLDALDSKRKDVATKLELLSDSSGDAYDDIKKGMKDAWQRLAIAKQAAAARFQ